MRRSIPLLLALLALPALVHAGAAAQLPRLDFNRRALETGAPLFWVSDADRDGVLDPAELMVTWGPELVPLERYVKGAAFTAVFDAAYAEMRDPPTLEGLAPAERRRREAVLAELAQGRPTLVQTVITSPRERAIFEPIERAARLIERLYARQTGVIGLEARIAPDDPASRSAFFRNHGPFCLAPLTETNPDCHVLPGRVAKVSGLYPASIQADPAFCTALAQRQDAAALLGWFSVVRHREGGRAEGRAATDALEAVPFHIAYAEEMQPVSTELMQAAAAAERDPAEAAFAAYLHAAARAFVNGDWYAADAAWKAMTATNSAWYLRIGPDEVLEDPCGRKSLFHLSFARINRESLAWQRKLDPVKHDLERALAAFAGRPYMAREVGFQLPDFIDVVLNAGDSRKPIGAAVGQSLPNSGPVSETGGRTVAMTNLNADPDSLAVQRERAAALLCRAALERIDFDPRHDTFATVLHEAAHNLGPSHDYQVDGRTAPQIFGGPLATTLEELKAQTAALYFPAWLAERGLLSASDAEQARLSNIPWSFGQIAQGMVAADGQPKPYPQLAAIQMGIFNQQGALPWRAAEKAANGIDAGCFDLDMTRWQPAAEELARLSLGIKGRGDRGMAERIRDAWTTEGTPWAVLRGVIRERWLRQPAAAFVYAIRTE